MASNHTERRKLERYDYISTVEYALSEQEKTFRAIASNISRSGLCLYLFELHREGQMLTFSRNYFPVPYRTAVIRWIKRENGELYRAGLVFVDEH